MPLDPQIRSMLDALHAARTDPPVPVAARLPIGSELPAQTSVTAASMA